MPHVTHLSKDKKFLKVLKNQEKASVVARKNVFINLVRSIVGQQLSTKAAATIYKRFLELYENNALLPEEVLNTPDELLRKAGLSFAKAGYIKNIASFWIEHKLTDRSFQKLSDEEIITLLVQIKGVGKWTVEMLLMFSLGREDVFSPDDLGIRKAMC
jgi:DNA-3-methyladenine glycosylase II